MSKKIKLKKNDVLIYMDAYSFANLVVYPHPVIGNFDSLNVAPLNNS